VYTTYTRPLSVQAQYSRSCPIISSSCYNSSLVTWTVVCLTAAKFKPLITASLESQSHIAADGQSVSLSWCRAPSGAHDQILVTVWQLLSCPWEGALSDERRTFVACPLTRKTRSMPSRSPWIQISVETCVNFVSTLWFPQACPLPWKRA
jgi:hypothetical protein